MPLPHPAEGPDGEEQAGTSQTSITRLLGRLPRVAGLGVDQACGRNTDRIPWAIHLSGKIEAMACIQPGSSAKAKKTPEMNCRISTTGVTTVGAARPDLGTEANAMPSAVPAAVPITTSHSNRTSGCRRRARHVEGHPGHGEQDGELDHRGHHDLADLAQEVGRGGIGVPRSSFSAPLSRSTAIEMARVWKLECMTPVATMPVR